MFFAEQFTGNIRDSRRGRQRPGGAVCAVDVANWLDLDWGLTGLALDPEFETNHYVYAFYTKPLPRPRQPSTPATSTPDHRRAPEPADDDRTAGGPPADPDGARRSRPADRCWYAGPRSRQASRTTRSRSRSLVRYTERDGKGEEMTVISDDFPVTDQMHAGYNANGNIDFGPGRHALRQRG